MSGLAVADQTPEQVIGAPSRSRAPRDVSRQILRSPTFLIGLVIVAFWVACALFGSALRALRPVRRRTRSASTRRPSGDTLVRHRPARPRRLLARHRRRARHPHGRAARDAARHRRSAPRSASRWATSAAWSTRSSAASSMPSWRCRWSSSRSLALAALGTSTATLIVVIGFVFAPIIARTVRAAVLAERELDYVAAAELRGERALVHHVRRDPAQRRAADPGRDHGAPRLRDLHRRDAVASSASASSRRRPTGACQISDGNYGMICAGYWWAVLFPALAIASLVVAVNLIADGIQQARAMN